MSYSLTSRTGHPGNYQFSRKGYAAFEQARVAAERAFASRGTEYLIEDENGPVTYRLKQAHES